MTSSDSQPELMDNRQDMIDKAEKMQVLIEDKNFKELFQDIYVDAFAITNMYNLHSYDDNGRRRFLEKALGRSIFVKFIDDILNEGREAIMSLQEELEDEQSTDEA